MKNFNKILTLILSIYNVIYSVNSMEDKECYDGLGQSIDTKRLTEELINLNINNEEIKIKPENNNITQSNNEETKIKTENNNITQSNNEETKINTENNNITQSNTKDSSKFTQLLTSNKTIQNNIYKSVLIPEDNHRNINLNINEELNKQTLNDTIKDFNASVNKINSIQHDSIHKDIISSHKFKFQNTLDDYDNLLKKYANYAKQLSESQAYLAQQWRLSKNKNSSKLDFSNCFNNVDKTIIDEKNGIRRTLGDIEKDIEALIEKQHKYNYYYNSIKLVFSTANICFYFLDLIYHDKIDLLYDNMKILKLAASFFSLYSDIQENYNNMIDTFFYFSEEHNKLRQKNINAVFQYIDILNNKNKQLMDSNKQYFDMFGGKYKKLKNKIECYNIIRSTTLNYYSQLRKQLGHFLNYEYTGLNHKYEYNSTEVYSINDIMNMTEYYIAQGSDYIKSKIGKDIFKDIIIEIDLNKKANPDKKNS